MERTATCHCGQLRVIATGEPSSNCVCHCKACQRRTGAVVDWGAGWRKTQVRIEGEQKIYARKADSGFEVRFHFCPNCGSNVFSEGDRTPEYWGITVGSFADPDFPPPTASVWEESMHSWLVLPTVSDHFQRGFPPAPTAGGSG